MTVEHEAAGVYDAHPGWGRPPSATQRERVERTLELVPEGVRTVLDVGCGDGALSNPLVARGLDVTGVDISAVALRHFRGRGVVGDVARLPFADGRFDLVLCTEVLEHLSAGVYERAVRELERVARRHILVATPNEEYLAAGHVKCAQCGHVYHRNHHCRVFDRAAHAGLFARFQPVETAAVGEREACPLVVWLEQRLLGRYRRRGHRCPVCRGTELVQFRKRGWRRLARKLIRLVGRAAPRRRSARWLATLYAVREG
jgi:SAM-dependent methyltransferase